MAVPTLIFRGVEVGKRKAKPRRVAVLAKARHPRDRSLASDEQEVRVTDPHTGGQKGMKLAQLGAVDPQSLLYVAKVAGHGATKYARYNFAKGYSWSLSFDALLRHLLQFWGGENTDQDSGLPHLAHAAWHCLALLTFQSRGRGYDDRFP